MAYAEQYETVAAGTGPQTMGSASAGATHGLRSSARGNGFVLLCVGHECCPFRLLTEAHQESQREHEHYAAQHPIRPAHRRPRRPFSSGTVM